MKNFRHIHGALSLETIEAKPVFDGDQIRALEIEERTVPRRSLRISWSRLTCDRPVSLGKKSSSSVAWYARQNAGSGLLKSPRITSSNFQNSQIQKRWKSFSSSKKPPIRCASPTCHWLSSSFGAGEYIAELPDGNVPRTPFAGHFGLAVKTMLHSTAPNRRYRDLLTQRLLKAALDGNLCLIVKMNWMFWRLIAPKQKISNKVERQVGKSAAALLLESRIGEQFDSIVTGASEKGTWVRLLTIPVEGKLVQGFEGLDVGHRIRVQLISINVERDILISERMKRGEARTRNCQTDVRFPSAP